MLAIPAEQVKILTPTELTHYRLSGDDANFDEKYIAEKARLWYLSSSQYRQRNAVVEKKCGYLFEKNNMDDYESFWRCQATIMLNISNAESDARYKKTMAECYIPAIMKDEQGTMECIYKIRAGK